MNCQAPNLLMVRLCVCYLTFSLHEVPSRKSDLGTCIVLNCRYLFSVLGDVFGGMISVFLVPSTAWCIVGLCSVNIW